MLESRECKRCHEVRPLAMFYVAVEGRMSAKLGREYRNHCRVCNREVMQAYRKPKQDYADAVKMERGCADCGIKSDHPEIYDFDHIPGADKAATVSSLLTKGSFEAFAAEIEKCEVVCANCHRIRTRSRDHAAFGQARS